ncbi:hypothetical protein EYZ11_006352 [Aspergillus tanneri]|uniref:Laccase, multicopper oxidase, benzenediol:oxygen oxidorectuctase n=1 Tax=Aspergillus tanneri TaxID=1220188 RepID=A0A4S3JFQ3_9EURO|nr:hypothetical protein EYZ11_006352 [Aspergillus tanneri]
MERQTSRRRKHLQVNEQSKTGQSRSDTRQKESAAKHEKHRSYRLLLYPLVVCFLIGLVFLYQSSTPDPILSVLSRPRNHRQDASPRAHDPDAFRPRIELHPEDHVYRDPRTQHYDWVVTSDLLRPDGVLKQVYLINGLLPGPTIEARSGDRLVVKVKNTLDIPISIHWHGIHISNSMDGVPSVTQCAISPWSTFTYNFTLPSYQSGTFWYHAHSGVIRGDGLYGGLVVHEPVPKPTVRGLMARDSADIQSSYDREFLFLIGDWYHQPAEEILAWFMSIASFGNEPVPDSLLVNGVGAFNCSMAVPAQPVDCIQQELNLSYLDTDIEPGYKLRIVNTGSLAGFTLSFENHQICLIQVDSIDTKPQEPTSAAGILYPGQRMDVILLPKSHNNTQSSMTIHLDQECFNQPNPALTHIQAIPMSSFHSNRQETPQTIERFIDLSQTPSSETILSHLPKKPHDTHVVYTKIQKLSINHNIPNGFFNHTSWFPQRHPPIPLNALSREKWDNNQFYIVTGDNATWVDIVVNNLDEGGHPFHLVN